MVGNYYAAMFETDRNRRAELLLLANAQGGLHEQTRLQTYIQRSLDAPIHDTLLAVAHAEVDSRIAHATSRLAAHELVDHLMPVIASRLTSAWEDFATIAMMQLVLPDGAVHLGRPIVCEPGQPPYPPELAAIEHPELREVLQNYNALDVPLEQPRPARAIERFEALLHIGHPLDDNVLSAAAVDWVEFDQRMRFIFTLFRSRAADAHLVAAPFTAEQTASLFALRLPTGPL
jgi:hypothetical protein